MLYAPWLLAAALAGWASGKIAGRDGFGTGADILLGITGAFVVRWSLENIGISTHAVYLILFSVWGAGGVPSPCEAWNQTPQSVQGTEGRAALSVAVGATRASSQIAPPLLPYAPMFLAERRSSCIQVGAPEELKT
jgi:uncharacterized membrane protein YeaQ/YmgE (transglycosylase-associated protein family)